MPENGEFSQTERVLVCAPFGRDGALVQSQLVAAGLAGDVFSSVAELSQAIGVGAGVGLISDEALHPEAVDCLRKRLAEQPPWSDFPLVIMTSGGQSTDASRYRLRLLEPLGNVNLVERPVRTATLVSSLQAALRARRHQYQLAAYLSQRDANERETAIRNEELLKANKMLEEFAYAAAHDLQEPLRMINIYAQLLVKKFAVEDQIAQEYSGYIQQGIKRMEGLLRDLLTFSRTIYADAAAIEKVDLSTSLSHALSTLNGRIKESEAVVECGSLPTVVGDEAQFAQVFQNLLSNAIKYRHAHLPPHIGVSARREGQEWIVSVQDNGIGFEPQYAQRIFGLFKRLHKDEFPGTGLGLAICQRIVERYGGRIWAEGQPGRGATFSFAIPDNHRTAE